MAFFVATTASVQAQGIEFEHGTWDEVVAKAKKENKPIFVDAYTTWCGPCKWMTKNVFALEEVGTYFKNNFIAYKMDMEKGEGPAFAKANHVIAYPTLLYFSATGEMIHKGLGARDRDALLKLSSDALDPAKQFVGAKKKYEGGERSKEFLQGYLTTLTNVGEDISTPFGEYWKMLNDDEKQSKDALTLLSGVTARFKDFKAPLTQYFLQHRVSYEKSAGKKSVAMLLMNCYVYSIWDVARTEDEKEQNILAKELSATFPQYKTEFKKRLAYLKLSLETPPDEPEIAKAFAKYLKVSSDADELNHAALSVYENSDDPKKLKEALRWINRSVEIDEGYANLYTRAALLYKLGDYKKAKLAAEKALKAATEEGFEEAPEDTVKLLENIKSKL
jgi:thiol-disulfide isomerase/thioredoxin